MIYNPEEKSRFETVLAVFQDYIFSHPSFDILYSPKSGYHHLTVDENDNSDFFPEPIHSADHLFELIAHEISYDVRDLFLCGEHLTVNLYPAEIDECRRRLVPYIERLPEYMREHFRTLMEKTLEQ